MAFVRYVILEVSKCLAFIHTLQMTGVRNDSLKGVPKLNPDCNFRKIFQSPYQLQAASFTESICTVIFRLF